MMDPHNEPGKKSAWTRCRTPPGATTAKAIIVKSKPTKGLTDQKLTIKAPAHRDRTPSDTPGKRVHFLSRDSHVSRSLGIESCCPEGFADL